MEGRQEAKRETARNLISMNILTDAQIAQASGLSEAEVQALRSETAH
jgi:predicted transposase YdaD